MIRWPINNWSKSGRLVACFSFWPLPVILPQALGFSSILWEVLHILEILGWVLGKVSDSLVATVPEMFQWFLRDTLGCSRIPQLMDFKLLTVKYYMFRKRAKLQCSSIGCAAQWLPATPRMKSSLVRWAIRPPWNCFRKWILNWSRSLTSSGDSRARWSRCVSWSSSLSSCQ